MKPLVSICCITYNQEKYIAHTLESFLMQRTDFAFEILIHDDASSDRTPDIIRQYQEMYPGLIKPILQEKNQFSQGIEIDYVYNFTRAAGKYTAYCEGDDYWTDEEKLQKQVDFLEKHPEASACFHSDKTINEAGTKVLGQRQAFTQDHCLTMEEVIRMDGKFAQNSILFRTELVQKEPMPQWYFDAPVSDYPLFLFLGLKGKVYYLNETMSAYRRAALNSWTRSVYQIAEKRKEHYAGLRKTLEEFDRYTDFQYTESVQKQIFNDEFILLICDKELKQLKSPAYQQLYEQLSPAAKAKLHLSYYLPFTLKINDWLKDNGSLYLLKPKEVFPVENLSIRL